MKYFFLKAVLVYLKKFKFLNSVYRVDDTILKLNFEDSHIYFDMKKSNSYAFKTDENLENKHYKAPFDIRLSKKINHSIIEDLGIVNEDKILLFKLRTKTSYKEEIVYLRFEFTGRHTNVIILDNNLVVLEALRHIDSNISSRVVRVGETLEEIVRRDFKRLEKDIDDIESYLYKFYLDTVNKELEIIKANHLLAIDKKISKLSLKLNDLYEESFYESKSKDLYNKANLVLANLHLIKNYAKEVKLKDFTGKEVIIDLPKNLRTPSMFCEKLFAMAKKAKQKAKNIGLQKENIKDKVKFLLNLKELFLSAKNKRDINILNLTNKNTSKDDNLNYASFLIADFKIILGKNEKGNIEVLKMAKANDLWFHLKGRPSCHTIIKSPKLNIPEDILYTAARFCVNFSVKYKGKYEVDYTKRREVKIREGAKVFYYNYKTIMVNYE